MENIIRIKKFLAYSLIMLPLLFVVISAVAPCSASAAEVERIDAPELQKMMNNGEELVIVDLREPWLFKKGHVPGAVNIPYEEAHDRVLKELNATDRIVFVCHGGPMGDEIGALLVKNGFDKVYNLIGGMRRWSGPVEK